MKSSMAEGTHEEQDQLPRFADVTLGHAFADELPELAIPWQAAPTPNPRIVALNTALAHELGLDAERLRDDNGVAFLSGSSLALESRPVAQLYAGHQFGAYSPVLGDGRALLLGEIHTPDGRELDLHLKGSGRTPPARGDGFAALGPMLREYLVSEAMHALGLPTTRALAVISTGRRVRRDDFQRDDLLPGALLVRVAASHLRVGSFQFARARGDLDLLHRLVDVALRRHYPEQAGDADPATALFRAVVRAQAQLVAGWMHVGFVHGVMNTDNVTISGETIDYGPCAFLDVYDPKAVFSSIDHAGRYAFGAQPAIAKWNLARFGEVLLPLLSAEGRDVAFAEGILAKFDEHFSAAWVAGMRAKLGLYASPDGVVGSLGEELLALLTEARADYTSTFRLLTDAAGDSTAEAGAPTTSPDPATALLDRLSGVDFHLRGRAEAWLHDWREQGPTSQSMRLANPVYVPRNHLLTEALEAATDGDYALFFEMLDAVTHPYEARPEWQRFAQPAPPEAGRFVSYCGT